MSGEEPGRSIEGSLGPPAVEQPGRVRRSKFDRGLTARAPASSGQPAATDSPTSPNTASQDGRNTQKPKTSVQGLKKAAKKSQVGLQLIVAACVMSGLCLLGFALVAAISQMKRAAISPRRLDDAPAASVSSIVSIGLGLAATMTGTASAMAAAGVPPPPLSTEQIWELREDARDAWYHGYDSYMEHGWPWDELKPLSCEGRRWDRRERGDLDDVLGGFSTTAIDSLDALVLLGDYSEFRRAVRRVVTEVRLDNDVTVSIFETTIRILGGLLSAHLIAEDPTLQVFPAGEYNGELLDMALDLGERLLPAFDTPTHIPVHRVNLRRGVMSGEKDTTCTAAAGTMLVEMGLLSRLTGRPEFESAALHAVRALWSRRSPLDIVGANVNTKNGAWTQGHSGIGAGVDSFHEYLFKAHILLGDDELLHMFTAARRAVNEHMLFGSLHVEVDMNKGRANPRAPVVSALQAFWPGLEVAAGDVNLARKLYRPLSHLWLKYEAIPDLYDVSSKKTMHFGKDAPLRPELIESTYFLYLATRDPAYLHRGAAFLRALLKNSKVECGFASRADVNTKRLDDRMDSYVLSETLKYLFLLFDAALGSHDAEPIVTTNGTCIDKCPTTVAVQPGAKHEVGDSTLDDFDECALKCVENVSAPAPSAHVESLQAPCLARPRLADLRRSTRGDVAAFPIDESKSLFTTEGHILMLTRELPPRVDSMLQKRVSRGKQPPAPFRLESGLDEAHQSCPAIGHSGSSWNSDALDDWHWVGQDDHRQHMRDKRTKKEVLERNAKALDGHLNQVISSTKQARDLEQRRVKQKQKANQELKKKQKSQQKQPSAPKRAGAVQASGQVAGASRGAPSKGKDEQHAVTDVANGLAVGIGPDIKDPASSPRSLIIRCVDKVGCTRRPSPGMVTHGNSTWRAVIAAFGPVLLDNGVTGIVSVPQSVAACESHPKLSLSETQEAIAVVARGHCSFARKVRSLQRAGAAGVVVLADHTATTMLGGGQYWSTVLEPDGVDEAITIPMVMLPRGSSLQFLRSMFPHMNLALAPSQVLESLRGRIFGHEVRLFANTVDVGLRYREHLVGLSSSADENDELIRFAERPWTPGSEFEPF